jgi:hypothetical protein
LVDSLSEGARRVSVRTIANQGGPVTSVNTQTGSVVLDADDIDDTSTVNKFIDSDEKDKIARIKFDQGTDTFLSGDGEYRIPPIIDAASTGDGAGLVNDVSSGVLRLKSILPGANTRFDIGSETITINSFGSSNVVREVIPAGTTSPYIITHNLNNENLFVEVFDNVTKANVVADIIRTDLNNLTISFTSELQNDAVVLIISGEVAGTNGEGGESIEFIDTASNGLTKVENDVQLGGTFNSDISLSSPNGLSFTVQSINNFFTQQSASLSVDGSDGGSNASVNLVASGSDTKYNALLLNSVLWNLNYSDSSDYTSLNCQAIDQIKVDSSYPTFQGLIYGNNYSANYTTRSLVDKEYVDKNQLTTYTVGTLPSATPAGRMVYVSNETGGAVPAFSDGTNWRRVTDRNIVS